MRAVKTWLGLLAAQLLGACAPSRGVPGFCSRYVGPPRIVLDTSEVTAHVHADSPDSVAIIDVKSGLRLGSIPYPGQFLASSLAADGRSLWIASQDGEHLSLEKVPIMDHGQLSRWMLPLRVGLGDFAPGGDRFSGVTGAAQIVDLDLNARTVLRGVNLGFQPVTMKAAAGHAVFFAGPGIWVYWPDQRKLNRLDASNDSWLDVALSPDGQRVAFRRELSSLRVYDQRTGSFEEWGAEQSRDDFAERLSWTSGRMTFAPDGQSVYMVLAHGRGPSEWRRLARHSLSIVQSVELRDPVAPEWVRNPDRLLVIAGAAGESRLVSLDTVTGAQPVVAAARLADGPLRASCS